MAALSERIFLFYGNDSWASLQAVNRWTSLFHDKYGEATFYTIEADELGLDETLKKIQTVLQVNSLFAAPQFILLRRVTILDRGGKTTASEKVMDVVKSALAGFPETTTLVLWEPRNLAPAHPILKQVTTLVSQKKARLHYFPLPTSAGLLKIITTYLQPFGAVVQADALNWLRAQYALREQEQRMELRLKSSDELLEDYRGWWLRSLLETVVLLSNGSEVTVSDLEKAQARLVPTASAFMVSDAFLQGDWSRVMNLFEKVENQNVDDGFYYSVLAIIRSQIDRRGSLSPQVGDYLLRLLSEVEIVGKNTSAGLPWLWTLLALKMQKNTKESLLEPRKVWLATLPR